MTAPEIRAIADAVLYEGYILYPYRKSALKNRQRWTFGGLFPKIYAGRGGDRWFMQCQCLVAGSEDTSVAAELRFLQVAQREIGKLQSPAAGPQLSWAGLFEIVPELQIGSRTLIPWEEAIEREIAVAASTIGDLLRAPLSVPFAFEALRTFEPVHDDAGGVGALIIRSANSLSAHVSLSATVCGAGLYRITLRAENRTAIEPAQATRRELAVPFSMASSHAILHAADGAFVSLIDPPEEMTEAARCCTNEGCWPVLVGSQGDAHAMLAAPIILYDYPQIAPESGRDLFDGTEIDEILILRTLTMTDAEKQEMAAGDERACELLQRIERLTPEELARLHGTWREVSAAPKTSAKPELVSLSRPDGAIAVGNRVRLKPRAGGDIMDLALDGKLAVIEAIERDFEDRTHVAVVLEDDPGRDFGLGRFPGHRFFFSPEEIETVAAETPP